MNKEETEQWIKDHPEEAKMIKEVFDPILESLAEAMKPLFQVLMDFFDSFYEALRAKYPDLIEFISLVEKMRQEKKTNVEWVD
jgi:hypothetical protein